MEKNLWSQFSDIVRAAPEQPAFIQGERVLSFADLQSRALAAASQLGTQGLAPGDRCVIWAGNSLEMATVLLGIVAAGAIPALVNVDAPISHFSNAVELTEASFAVVDHIHFDSAGFSGKTLDISHFKNLQPHQNSTVQSGPIVETGPASILFTSGSTGLPKGVTQSHKNLLWGCDTVGRLLNLTRKDRILCGIPWSFDYGWGQFLSTCLLGITQIIPDGRGATKFCEALALYRPTILPGVPSLFADLIMGLSPIRDIDRSSVRLITNTGSTLSPALLTDLRALFPDAKISLNYGLTETYRSTSLPMDLSESHPNSVGYAIPGVTISVLAQNGQKADVGEVGEIVHQGPGVFLGYWGQPDRTDETRRDIPNLNDPDGQSEPAVFTGDIGWMDDDGLLYIKGRRDRQIKSMGVRVSPDEIESIIVASGLVRQAAVIARSHHSVGQQVIALVVANENSDISKRDLRKMARETMSPYMQPMDWVFVEQLPRTPNQKVDYVALVAQFASDGPQ